MNNQEEIKEEIYILDSFALLAHLERTNGWQKVLELLERAANGELKLYMSLVNLGEVYYILKRERGLKEAENMVLDVDQLPIKKLDADWERIKSAASIKADYPIAYADAFVAGLAKELGAPVVTGDLEFKHLEEIISVVWL
ncbi:MAG: type II toxin-antitoxin system VapC family toxin [Actinomycetota bacterium]